jgi:methionyl-tRNA formyltransferase
MRLVFMATGDIALSAFHHLLDVGPRPLALVTQPDKPVGRHQILTPPAIKTLALAAGIPVLQPLKAGDAAEQIASLKPDIIVVMAYGQILRSDILELPGTAVINLHASLLPKYRGAACIQAAIDAGDAESGITSLHVVRELDAGDIILARSIPLAPDETGGSLHDRLSDLAPQVLAETLARISDGTAPRVPQNPALVSYVSKLERDAGRLDWNMPAIALERRIRAYHPWPGTYTISQVGGKSQRLKILPPCLSVDRDMPPGSLHIAGDRLIVGCGHGALELGSVQPDGSKVMSAADYLRGKKPESLR